MATPPAGRELVDWGPTGRTRPNPWVTVDALYVLQRAGRLKPRPRDPSAPGKSRPA